MRFELCYWWRKTMKQGLKDVSRGEKGGVGECCDAQQCDPIRSGQSSPAGAAALTRFEMRKSRSWSFDAPERGRAEPCLGGGESLHSRHGATAVWAKP